jgi:alkylhydroperoxidase family enzyme
VNGDSKSWKVTGKRRQHFNEKELVDLTLAVIAINGRKRLAIPFRAPVGDYQPRTPRQRDKAAS